MDGGSGLAKTGVLTDPALGHQSSTRTLWMVEGSGKRSSHSQWLQQSHSSRRPLQQRQRTWRIPGELGPFIIQTDEHDDVLLESQVFFKYEDPRVISEIKNSDDDVLLESQSSLQLVKTPGY